MADVRTVSLDEVSARLDGMVAAPDAELMATAPECAGELLALGEAILETWLMARGETPTDRKVEGFRLLALHRQGARGEPSFNACQSMDSAGLAETCSAHRSVTRISRSWRSMTSLTQRRSRIC